MGRSRRDPRILRVVYGTLFAIALAVVGCAILYRLANPPRRRATTRDLRAQLRDMTHDPEVADRLIERMRKRHPDAGELALVKLAIAELRSDRRR